MFAAGLTAVACSDSAAPARQPLALAGTWAVSDTFGLIGTITLSDASIGDGIRDTLARWIQLYGDTIDVVGFARGQASLVSGGSALAPQTCGIMMYRRWQYPPAASNAGARSDTTSGIQLTCQHDDIMLVAASPILPTAPVSELPLVLWRADTPGLVDPRPICAEVQGGCPSPFFGSAVTLRRQ